MGGTGAMARHGRPPLLIAAHRVAATTTNVAMTGAAVAARTSTASEGGQPTRHRAAEVRGIAAHHLLCRRTPRRLVVRR